jgi:hypothetical protein
VRVVRHGRSRALVEAAGGRQYWVVPTALSALPSLAAEARAC